MASMCDNNYAYNTFIFNWVKNYDDQVIVLKNAMESLKNKVQIHNHLTSEQLTRVVNNLSYANFELYNYIVVIILDNESELEQFVKTSDKENVLLHSEILTRIQTNSTLQGITRLFVIQKLLDFTDIDDEDVDKITEMVKKRQDKWKQSDILHSGLTITIRASEYTKNFILSPFINVFARSFQKYAKTLPINMIYKGITKEIKYGRGYRINLEFGSNGNTNSNLLLGNGISSDVLRDFF